ncbi:release factor glutamine methyltransferase [Pseudohongiella nitratireducens]|uniref:Release factor glutamine methyltransferase n=1 Tax=Pseudohongiella nitratireducens TaxID=1768907 RepID=A0A917LRD2_9GAMM|nr:peptide chain release factor N(5)-glutamine methyltransferase [Pseudohongiella nitratireducens]GGG52181.1 release factor glutamine methyltransferase [Pseudohongiella nitratireducens]|tara:strand:+ start:144 stop:1004 length:861 start_codon:yes stop_codon:yes gene_type:complete
MACTVKQLIQSSAALLRSSDTALLDSELLLAEVLGVTRTHIMMYPEKVLSDEQQGRFLSLIDRRVKGEPLAYITGKQGFWTLELTVTPDVLVPRPETELLVEIALDALPADRQCRVLDLGTGSGAIALSLASERPAWTVCATDASARALAVANQNAKKYGLSDRVTWIAGNWFDPVASSDRFDLILSNPPYLADDDSHLGMGALPFEPVSALVATDAGLGDFKTIIGTAPGYLVNGGQLLVEHGCEQGSAVRTLFDQAKFADIRTIQDLAGLDRVTVGKMPGSGKN